MYDLGRQMLAAWDSGQVSQRGIGIWPFGACLKRVPARCTCAFVVFSTRTTYTEDNGAFDCFHWSSWELVTEACCRPIFMFAGRGRQATGGRPSIRSSSSHRNVWIAVETRRFSLKKMLNIKDQTLPSIRRARTRSTVSRWAFLDERRDSLTMSVHSGPVRRPTEQELLLTSI